MADWARAGDAGTVPLTHWSRPSPGCVLAPAGSRLPERDAAAAGPWLERSAQPRGVEAVDQPSEQREVHLADDLGVALGDGVERAVAQADDALLVVDGLVAALLQERRE